MISPRTRGGSSIQQRSPVRAAPSQPQTLQPSNAPSGQASSSNLPDKAGAQPTGSVLVLMQQLRDAQQSLRMSDARCEVLEDENRKLRLEVKKHQQQQQQKYQQQGSGQALHSAQALEEISRRDQLISELQTQLTETLRRNTFLEGEAHTQHTTMRNHYETHVDRLEMELRRARVISAQPMNNNSQQMTGYSTKGSPPSSAMMRTSSSQGGYQSTTPGRRDLL